jgi:copper(I)-binding protein
VTATTATPDRAEDEDRPRPARRPHLGLVAAVLAVLLGVVGLVVGASQEAPAGSPAGSAAEGSIGSSAARSTRAGAPADAVTVGDMTVSGGYVRQPASPDVAAAYLTMRNAGADADELLSVYSGGATGTTLHGQPGAVRPGAHEDSGPIAVPPKVAVTLSPGRGHIMLEGLTGPLRPGDRVSLLLRFRIAGQLLVEAPVIAIGAPAPGGAS